jgi:hypothetical protein
MRVPAGWRGTGVRRLHEARRSGGGIRRIFPALAALALADLACCAVEPSEPPADGTSGHDASPSELAEEDLDASTPPEMVDSEEAAPVDGETIAGIVDAATRVRAFTKEHARLPNYVTMGAERVDMPSFLMLEATALLEIAAGASDPEPIEACGAPASSGDTTTCGPVARAEYLEIAGQAQASLGSDGRAPGSLPTSRGAMGFENLVYTFSGVLAAYGAGGRLPDDVTLELFCGQEGLAAFHCGTFRPASGCEHTYPWSRTRYYRTTTDGWCPACGKRMVVFDSWKHDVAGYACSEGGGYTCLNCDSDYDGITGWETSGLCLYTINILSVEEVVLPDDPGAQPCPGGPACGMSCHEVKVAYLEALGAPGAGESPYCPTD